MLFYTSDIKILRHNISKIIFNSYRKVLTNRKKNIKKVLDVLEPHYLEIIDNSAQHANHFDSLGESETHLKIKIASNKLKNLTIIQQHKTINDLLKNEFSNGLHALSIKIIDS